MQSPRSIRNLIAAVGAAACVMASPAAAQPGTSFTYQGVLTSAGTNVDTAVMVDFKLFDADVAGAQVGSTISSMVTPVDGVFSESLDFGVNAYVPNQALWLEITVEGDVLGRQKLEAAPFALNTRGIDVNSSGDVGIGTANPSDKLHLADTGPAIFRLEADTDNANETDHARIDMSQDGGNVTASVGFEDEFQNDFYIRTFDTSSQTADIFMVPEGEVIIKSGMALGDGVTAEQDIDFFSANGGWQLGSNDSGSSVGADNNHFYLYDNSSQSYVMSAPKGSGRIGIGTRSPATTLDVNGAVTIRGGADIVEGFETATSDVVEPGTLMVIDPANPGKLMLSTQAYDAKVAGVVSGANGVNPGIKLGQDGTMDGDLPVAMTGRVYVKCSAENGPVMPGDRLTTSSIPGHAMKATDSDRSDGAVIGKAMTSLDSETGMVLVLVNLQ
ncbi:MAG TPA: hypothetical protein ENJ00_00670 [Phycisphaerales bacterium]|nr:hypothetical protein [Phycisphaerales bacterium]